MTAMTWPDPSHLFADVENWLNKSCAHPPDVQPGSALDRDAHISPTWQVAHSAWGAWVSAVDNMDALRQLLTAAKVVHSHAPYSLLRVAIENAAVSAWLLQPESSEERVTRRLQLARDELHDIAQLPRLAGPAIMEGKRSVQDRRDAIKVVASSANLDRDRICGRFSWGNLVHEAASAARANADIVELLWRLCSGFAHARAWARHSWLDAERIAETDDGIVTLSTTTDIGKITAVALAARYLLKAGEKLYDERRLYWRTH